MDYLPYFSIVSAACLAASTLGGVGAVGECRIRPSIGTILKKSGETMSIYCTTTTDNPVVFYKDNRRVAEGVNVRIEGLAPSKDKVLRITNLTRDDGGQYKCSLATDCTIRVKVYGEISFPRHDTEKIQYIRQGRAGNINCTSEGDPSPENEWFLEGKKILSGDRIFAVTDGNLDILGGASLNESVFTCRASLPDFSYYRDFNITLGVLKSEPLSCLQCRTFDVGQVGDSDACSLGSEVNQHEECSSSCVTVNATGPLSGGKIKYAMARGCGDRLSVLKDTCVRVPNEKLSLDALTLFGDATGLTAADVCFCSSGDGCNSDPKTFSAPAVPSLVVAYPADPAGGNAGPASTRATFSVVVIALLGFCF